MATTVTAMTSSCSANKAPHPFFKTSHRNSANPTASLDLRPNNFGSSENGPTAGEEEAESLVADPNLDRRKRRKLGTAPKDSSWDWFFQLQAEAGKVSRNEASRSNTIADNNANDAEKPTGEAGSDEQDASNPVRHKPADTEEVGELLASGAPEKPATKLLGLNGKGGLALPAVESSIPALDGTYEPKIPKKRGRKPKKLLVTLRYGESNLWFRASLGEKINAIMEDRQSPQERQGEDSRPAATHATNPMKPTHPFFLGKESKKSEGCGMSPLASKARTEEEQTSKPHTQAFSTPGKLINRGTQHHLLQNQSKAVLSYSSKAPKPPASRHPWPRWPWKNFVRAEPAPDRSPPASKRHGFSRSFHLRRFKNKTEDISIKENIMKHFENCLKSKVAAAPSAMSQQALQSPRRLMETGSTLQARLEPFMSSPISSGGLRAPVAQLFGRLRDSLSAFDVGECESTLWSLKYAPRSAHEVLQSTKEMLALREWLASLTTNAVEKRKEVNCDSRPPAPFNIQSAGSNAKKAKRKRRKRVEGLDDFLVSSEDDSTDLRDFSDDEELGTDIRSAAGSRSVIQPETAPTPASQGTPRKTNAVLLSGAHGCGKTAAAYAVAQELGFDVFEINSASRRSGKDILEKVGDMALNHQVRRGSDASTSFEENPFACENNGEQQSSIQTFFSAATKTFGAPNQPKKSKEAVTRSRQLPSKQQKQSLILLEEVDVLFEDDKQFWETVIDLASQSKRPIIMTCNNEDWIPFEMLSLYAIFRFRQPPADLATDYLLLVAALEGHLIARDAAHSLYQATGHDFRASLTELNFWCQMAVGDTKGGLEWFMQTASSNPDSVARQQQIRAVSDETYKPGMGWLPRQFTGEAGRNSLLSEDLLLAAWSDWAINPTSVITRTFCDHTFLDFDNSRRMMPSNKHAVLADTDTCTNLLSDNDVFSRIDLPTSDLCNDRLDSTQPALPETRLSNYSQSLCALQADKACDYSQIDTQITIHICIGIARYLDRHRMNSGERLVDSVTPRTIETSLRSLIESQKLRPATSTKFSRVDLLEAVGPIIDIPDASGTAYNGLAASSFDRPTSSLAEDVVPYVRSIVSYDIAREQQRQSRASALLHGARSSKRLRTTKASRSALEGGQRATTRRERWFPKELDYQKVKNTAGDNWPQANVEDFDRAPSVASGEDQ